MENQNLEQSNKKSLKIRIVFMIMAVLVMIAGSTFAYWSWQSSETQKTAVTLTVTAGFSCSADGGGNLVPGDIELAPASCTNSTYAIKRTVTVSPTITNADGGIYMDLWLKVNSIGSGLANSQNFKYALTTSSSNCTTGVVAQGNFNGATTNTQKTLLHNKAYTTTTNETYYLWIWLDAAETSPTTMNQTFDMELGGVCTDNAPSETVYTANINYYNHAENGAIIGSPIPDRTTTYNSPEAAMAALKTSLGASTDLPFFLKQTTESGIVTANYVGFVVTPQMASNNPGMTAGTYYLRGDNMYTTDYTLKSEFRDPQTGGCMTSQYYDANKAVLQRAFGTNNSYCEDISSGFHCYAPGLEAWAETNGWVRACDGRYSYCHFYCLVFQNGRSRCNDS